MWQLYQTKQIQKYPIPPQIICVLSGWIHSKCIAWNIKNRNSSKKSNIGCFINIVVTFEKNNTYTNMLKKLVIHLEINTKKNHRKGKLAKFLPPLSSQCVATFWFSSNSKKLTRQKCTFSVFFYFLRCIFKIFWFLQCNSNNKRIEDRCLWHCYNSYWEIR